MLKVDLTGVFFSVLVLKDISFPSHGMTGEYEQGVPQSDGSLWVLHSSASRLFTNVEAIRIVCFWDAATSSSCSVDSHL